MLPSLDRSSPVGDGVDGCSGLAQDEPEFDPPLWGLNPFSMV